MKHKTTAITIVEHIVRQYLVEEKEKGNSDPWDESTYIEESEVSPKVQESFTGRWEYA